MSKTLIIIIQTILLVLIGFLVAYIKKRVQFNWIKKISIADVIGVCLGGLALHYLITQDLFLELVYFILFWVTLLLVILIWKIFTVPNLTFKRTFINFWHYTIVYLLIVWIIIFILSFI